MRFYRVSFSADGGNSAGYVFTTSRAAAQREAAQAVKNDPYEYVDHRPEVTVVKVTPTKRGILRALNAWASHPHNG